MLVDLAEGPIQHPLRGVVALLDGVISVYQDLGLDYGDEVVLLGERRIKGERLSVGPYTALGRDAIPYRYDGPPLGEARPELGVFGEPVAESVETLGELLAFRKGQIDGALIHLDTWDDAGVLERPGHRGAVRSLLADGLVEEDHTGEELPDALRREEHLPVGPTALFARLYADGLEPLAYGAEALVCGEYAFPRCYELAGRLFELSNVHRRSPSLGPYKRGPGPRSGARDHAVFGGPFL